MKWLQFHFFPATAQQESLEDALLAAGALSITYQDGADQPILEPALHETPLWDRLILTALFPGDADSAEILDATAAGISFPLPEYRMEKLEDRDWSREWMDNFHPMPFGERLWVCPSWCAPPQPDAINLLLDPGLAFGTGTHPTTALCLKQLDGMDLRGKTVIDFGCGSGILAIAALLLGAETAVGIDIDPQALDASRANAETNHIPAEKLALYLAGQEPVVCRADLVLANILAGPLVALAERLMAQLGADGELILSGLLAEQQEEVIAAYPLLSFTATTDQGWACLRGRRKGH